MLAVAHLSRMAVLFALLGASMTQIAGEPAAKPGLVARWHNYSSGLGGFSEIILTERLDGIHYRLDMSGHAAVAMGSDSKAGPLYFDREDAIDSLEAGDLTFVRMLVDRARARIIMLDEMPANPPLPRGYLYNSYPYAPSHWLPAVPGIEDVAVAESVGIDQIAGHPARHYRLRQLDADLPLFNMVDGPFRHVLVTDLWISGPNRLLDWYFGEIERVPVPEPVPDPRTGGVEYQFHSRGLGGLKPPAALHRVFADPGYVVRTEVRAEYRGPGVASEIPLELDPGRATPARSDVDTVRSVLCFRASLASLHEATVPDREFDLPQGARTPAEFRKSLGAPEPKNTR